LAAREVNRNDADESGYGDDEDGKIFACITKCKVLTPSNIQHDIWHAIQKEEKLYIEFTTKMTKKSSIVHDMIYFANVYNSVNSISKQNLISSIKLER